MEETCTFPLFACSSLLPVPASPDPGDSSEDDDSPIDG